MMTLNRFFVVACLLCAANAWANWTVVYPNAATVNAGQSGSSTFLYTPDINGTITANSFSLNVVETAPSFGAWSSAGGSGNPISSFSIASEPASFTSGHQFAVVVNWTISSSPVSSPTTFFLNFGLPTSNGTQTSSQNFTLNPTSVAEPSQVLAGSMLFGCGALIFTGRRWMKKQGA
jgi:hypothetical protein